MIVNFIDKTSTVAGTKINRANLMAMQGFMAGTTVFSGDTITETNATGGVLTTTFGVNTITQRFVEGGLTITKTITFNANGTITEAIS